MNVPDQIEHIAVEALVPYARNSRTHSASQVDQISASIREFGFTNPVLIGADDTIIAGHGRVMAARQIGLDRVPCIRLGHLSEAQRRAYVIADNKLAMNAGWDDEILAAELRAISDDGFDMDLLGFSADELVDLLPQDTGPAGDPDDVPEVDATPITQIGDVWMLGKHRVMCGSATNAGDVDRLTRGGVDMWLTDPPYNVDYTGKTKDALKIGNDSMGDAAFRQFLRAAFLAANNAMNPGSVFYIWHADSEGFNFRGACADVGWKVRQCLIWNKNTMVMGRQDYHWKHEPCLYGWKDGAGHLWASDRKQVTIINMDRPTRSAEHPTMKPVALFEYLMLNNTKVGGRVLDSFGGSGTTLIAAEKNGRVACVMELDPTYVDVTIRRWQQFTGLAATLERDGRSFDRVAVGR